MMMMMMMMIIIIIIITITIIIGRYIGNTFDRFTTKDNYTWNITHYTESIAV